MRTKITILGFVIVLTAILCQIPAQGNITKALTTKARLEALVDEYIACCEAKSALRGSRSEKIRHSAVRSCMKADFYRYSKKELVELMLENNIEPKDYKVRLFLNERFNVILQAKE